MADIRLWEITCIFAGANCISSKYCSNKRYDYGWFTLSRMWMSGGRCLWRRYMWMSRLWLRGEHWYVHELSSFVHSNNSCLAPQDCHRGLWHRGSSSFRVRHAAQRCESRAWFLWSLGPARRSPSHSLLSVRSPASRKLGWGQPAGTHPFCMDGNLATGEVKIVMVIAFTMLHAQYPDIEVKASL